MYSFKQFIFETYEHYDKIKDPKRREELIKYHSDLSGEHANKSKEHLDLKANKKQGLSHSIAAEAHRDAAQLHSHTASALEMKMDGANDFRIRAEKMSLSANQRSEIANK